MDPHMLHIEPATYCQLSKLSKLESPQFPIKPVTTSTAPIMPHWSQQAAPSTGSTFTLQPSWLSQSPAPVNVPGRLAVGALRRKLC